MKGVDAVVVCVVRGCYSVLKGFKDSRGGLGCSTEDGQVGGELIDYDNFVDVEAGGGLWKELGVETEDSFN